MPAMDKDVTRASIGCRFIMSSVSFRGRGPSIIWVRSLQLVFFSCEARAIQEGHGLKGASEVAGVASSWICEAVRICEN